MKNRVLAENLYKALKEVKLPYNKRLPVLNYIRITFDNGQMELVSTNIDEFYATSCPCIQNESWSTCVPNAVRCDVSNTYKPHWRTFNPFMDFVKLHAEYKDVLDMEFLPEIQTLIITVGRSRTEFKCIDAQEFPPC